MAPKRKPLERRRFPRPEDLEQMRLDLALIEFDLKLGPGGYWYARSYDGMECYTNADARRATCLALVAAHIRAEKVIDDIWTAAVESAIRRHSQKGK
jgi:hypothetical protein